MNSCLYEGELRHRRHVPVSDRFSHRVTLCYLDLDELPQAFDGSLLWSARRPAAAWFRRADHLGDPDEPLGESVRRLVAERTGSRPEGPVCVLTSLRQLGYCFNPVSFYYCHDRDGELCAAVALVTSTPWHERHAYVLPTGVTADHGSVRVAAGAMDKRMHVSPLMGMEQRYSWSLTVPGERLSVHIASSEPGAGTVFDATLSLRRLELTPANMRSALLRHPLGGLATTGRIYAHALRLRLRGVPWHPRPRPAAIEGS